MFLIDVHDLNVLSLMVLMLFDKVISLSLIQYENAPCPIELTFSGIMIDFNPEKTPYWKLNEQGRIRIAMTKQEKLDRLRASIVEAQEKGDKATMEALMKRHSDVANSDESDMTCFHFLDDLKLCYRDNEWVIMKQLPPPEADPNEWINALTARLSKFFSFAGKTIMDFFEINEQAPPKEKEKEKEVTESTSEILIQEPKDDPDSRIAVSEPPAPTVKEPKDTLIESLDKDISNLIRIVSAGKNEEEIANLANDEKNPRIARLVRTFLCTDIAAFASYGFKKERLFGFGANHIWDWVASYGTKRVVSATSINLLGMQKAIATVESLQYDKNASFRGFICLALNSQMLGTWFDLIVNDVEKMDKFFRPDALLRNQEVLSSISKQLARLSKVPFSLSLDFEARNSSANPK